MDLGPEVLFRLGGSLVTIAGIFAIFREKLNNVSKAADELKAIASSLRTSADQQLVINKGFDARISKNDEKLEEIEGNIGELQKDVAVIKDRCDTIYTARSVVTDMRRRDD